MTKIIADRVYLIGTYGLAFLNIGWSFDLIKSIIIFIATMVLLCIQIKLHYKRLKKEEGDETKEGEKKNKFFRLRKNRNKSNKVSD